MLPPRPLLLPAIVAATLAARAAAAEPQAVPAAQPQAVPAAAPPAEPAAQPLTERDFVARVLAASPRIEVIAARVELARAEIADARRRPNPSLAADREQAGGEAETIVRLELPLELSGRRGARIRAAERGVEAAAAEAALDRELLALDALDVYYDAARARLRAAALRDSRDGLAQAVDIVRARKAAGESSGYDLERLELELGAYDDAIADADLDLAAGRRRLAVLAGAPDAVLDAIDPLDPPGPPGPAADPARDAARDRGDHRAALLRADQAQLELAAARRAWIPTLTLGGGLKLAAADGASTELGYVAGLALELPLFDRDQGARARSLARMREQRAAAQAIEREVALAVAVARDELARRLGQLAAYEQAQVARVPALIRRAEISYREGDRPIVELLDAYRTARDIRLRALELRVLTRRAQLALGRARGHR